MWRIRSSILSFKEIPVVEHENISTADLGFTPSCLTNVGRLTGSHDLPLARAPRLRAEPQWSRFRERCARSLDLDLIVLCSDHVARVWPAACQRAAAVGVALLY